MQGHTMDLLLKISVLQANYCCLGDLGEIICPWKESVAGKTSIQGVWGDLMFRIASSSISLAGSEEQINFSQQSPKMLKWLQKALFMLCCCFSVFFSKFPVGCPCTCFWAGLSSCSHAYINPQVLQTPHAQTNTLDYPIKVAHNFLRLENFFLYT